MADTPILLYHQISAEADPDDPFRLTVTPRDFERQMRFLAQSGYRCVTLQEALALRAGNRNGRKTFAITFDDGYADNYEAAYPVLKALGFVATIFVVTGFIGQRLAWPGNRPVSFLSLDQMRMMMNGGIEFGAHTVTHPNLHEITATEATHEISASRRVLQQNLQRTILYFAYPGGHQTPEIQDMVRAAGYDGGLGVDIGPDVPYNTWRVQINGNDSMTLFRLKVSGHFERLKRFRQSSQFAHRLTQTAGQLLNRGQ